MTPQVASLAKMMATSDRLFLRALDGADRDALLHRPGGAGNPMLWIAGHATNVRLDVLFSQRRRAFTMPWRTCPSASRG